MHMGFIPSYMLSLPSEDTRRKRLEDDPAVQLLSAHSVICKTCSKPIQLSKRSTYAWLPWGRHRKYCVKSTPLAREGGADVEILQVNNTGARHSPRDHIDTFRYRAHIQTEWSRGRHSPMTIWRPASSNTVRPLFHSSEVAD